MACSGCAQRRAKMLAFAKSMRNKFTATPIKSPAARSTGEPLNVDGVKIIDIRRKEA